MGYEKEAAEIQDKYLSGDKAGAAAAIPHELIDQTTLLGSVDRIADRMQAYAAAGVTTLTLAPAGFTLDERLAVAPGGHRRPGARRTRVEAVTEQEREKFRGRGGGSGVFPATAVTEHNAPRTRRLRPRRPPGTRTTSRRDPAGPSFGGVVRHSCCSVPGTAFDSFSDTFSNVDVRNTADLREVHRDALGQESVPGDPRQRRVLPALLLHRRRRGVPGRLGERPDRRARPGERTRARPQDQPGTAPTRTSTAGSSTPC